MHYIKNFLVIIICLCTSRLFAQSINKGRAAEELEALAQHYRSPGKLSFDIIYRYASEEQPAVFLDSVKGSFSMYGSKYWCLLDSTETIGTGDYTLTLFHEDHIMYLNKYYGSSNVSPVSMMDSLIRQSTGIQYELAESKNAKVITLIFPAGATNKRTEYVINKHTGYLDKMRSWIKSNQLFDVSVRPLVTDINQYVILETSFNNYRLNVPNDELFQTSYYLKREGNQFVTMPAFAHYQIFIGSPDL